MPFLRYRVRGQQQYVSIKPAVFTIGRSPQCDLSLEDGNASRQHARLIVDKDSVILQDLQSKNGTYVNGQPIQTLALSDGDVIAIGDHQLTYALKKK